MMFLQKPMLGAQLGWSNPLNDEVVLDLLMNEGYGDRVNDLSGGGNHGTLHGFDFPPTRTSGWNPGMDGVCLAFDKSNDFIVTDSTGYDKDRGTLLVDAYPKDNEGTQYVASIGTGAPNEETIFRFYNNRIDINVNGVWRILKSYDVTTLFNELHRFIFTWDDIHGLYKLYLDGVDVGGAASTDGSFTSDGTIIGRDPKSAVGFFGGAISRLCVLPRAMSAFEVMQTQIDPYGVYQQ